jgi:hypothetical protein
MNIKILKLRSGEEIACQVLEENDTKMKISKPMLFKTSSSQDLLGRTIDITTLHDWLINTDNKDVEIPVNHIAFISEPSKDSAKLYEMESAKEFNPDNFKTSIKEDHPLDMPSNLDAIDELNTFGTFLEDLLKNSSNLMEPKEPKRKKKKKKEYLPPDMTDENELDRHMIMMQLYIPAESIMNMVTSGMLDPKVLLKMVEEVKKRNRFTGDEKDREDFGNKFSDWNPDPNSDDYNKG